MIYFLNRFRFLVGRSLLAYRRGHPLLFPILLIIFATDLHAQQEKKLLSDALTLFASISDEVPAKDRIALYENGLTKIYIISDEFGSTDIGLSIKGSGKYGDFNFVEIRRKYISEVSTYYTKTCQVSPSVLCQGWTAYNDGIGRCKGSPSFRNLDLAHTYLKDSMEIFRSEEKNIALFNEAKDAYLKCPKVANDIANTDQYFKYRLADLLFDFDELSNGTAITEQLKEPYYKFLLSLKKLNKQNQPLTDQRYRTLIDYINNNFKKLDPKADIMKLGLLEAFYNPNNQAKEVKPHELRFHSNVSFDTCHQDSQIIFERAHNVIVLAGNRFKPSISSGIEGTFLGDFAADLERLKWIDNCDQQFTLVLTGEAYLYGTGKAKEARQFIKAFQSTNISNNKLKIIETYLDFATEPESRKLPQIPKNMTIGVDAHFAIFKKLLDIDQVCDASKLLKASLKNSQYDSAAMKYIAKYQSSSGKRKVSCGDEDLEMMLR
jgi:hypothetical protein